MASLDRKMILLLRMMTISCHRFLLFLFWSGHRRESVPVLERTLELEVIWILSVLILKLFRLMT